VLIVIHRQGRHPISRLHIGAAQRRGEFARPCRRFGKAVAVRAVSLPE